ncbi:hypothetical protein B0H14DRAFT_2561840 [Mycena olivaceomarginata]|nr:hypothetical protein B0H14DRAFT_2561840 [Mycena olivaceomarginata]
MPDSSFFTDRPVGAIEGTRLQEPKQNSYRLSGSSGSFQLHCGNDSDSSYYADWSDSLFFFLIILIEPGLPAFVGQRQDDDGRKIERNLRAAAREDRKTSKQAGDKTLVLHTNLTGHDMPNKVQEVMLESIGAIRDAFKGKIIRRTVNSEDYDGSRNYTHNATANVKVSQVGSSTTILSTPSLLDLLNNDNIAPQDGNREALEKALFDQPDPYDLMETARVDGAISADTATTELRVERSSTHWAVADYVRLDSSALAKLIYPEKDETGVLQVAGT